MNESKESKIFGITMPLFLVAHIILLIVFPIGKFNLAALILHGAVSLWFIISYTLLIRRQMKDIKDEFKQAVLRDSKKSF